MERPSIDEPVFSAVLMVKEQGKDRWQGKGTHYFRVLPRVGDYIEKNFDGIGFLFEVVGVVHPAEVGSGAADILAVQRGLSASVRKQVHEESAPASTEEWPRP